MLRKLIPRTVVGQLMAMLAVVLLIAQIINLALLVGEQRLQARSKAYNEAIEHSVRLITQLPEELPATLPAQLPKTRGGPQGAIFLSQINRAQDNINIEPLPRYNQRFQARLKEEGISPLQTSVSFLKDGPKRPKAKPSGPEKIYARDNRPPPPRGERGRKPPPQDGLFHPDERPRRGAPELGGPEQRGLQEIRLSVEIEPGIWFNAMMPHSRTESFTSRIILSTALLLGLTLLAAWVFARRISRPLSDFTRAAESLGRGEVSEALEEAGPMDIRQAATAFNTMQTRLTRTLDTQRTMLRAVGHDLRTPLTSLRIRAENIPQDLDRDKFIATINDMTVMTEEILSWAKDASGTEELAAVNLEALLASVTDDYQDQGRDVSLKDFNSVTIRIRRSSLKRALQNLINNALQYGHRARLSVEHQKGRVLIHIDDDGPGVAEAKLAEIMKPFIRLETSRSKETGGTGLGLSIAESIAQIHGGQILLSNRKPNGLRATISLPI
ncbi:MAG: ATP-binding protein [Hellea sp.]